MPPHKKPRSKASSAIKLFAIVAIALILVAGAYTLSGKNLLRKASLTDSCDLTVTSIDDVRTVSNEPTLNNDRAYLLTVTANKGGECLKVTLTQDDFKRFGISDVLFDNITLSAKVQDLSQEYKVESDTIFYKLYESTASDDLSQAIPYSSVSIKTTQLSAVGKFSDPNGQAPAINHLGNFPSGGDVNLMKDVGKWAYLQDEASNIPFGADKSGNWWVTHMGGIPYYRGYRIDTMAFNKYSVLFTLDKGSERLSQVAMDEQNRIGNLGDIARIKFSGSLIDAVFPSQPAVDYAVVGGLEGTPVSDQFKFVSKYRYNNYKGTMDELVNFDNNYFERSWSDIQGTLVITSIPDKTDIYINNKYYGFTPLTLKDLDIGRYTLVGKKKGFQDATEEFNLNAGETKKNIKLAQIAPPDVSISLNPTTVIKGNPATLSWSVKGIFERVKLYDPTPTTVESTGSKTVYPQETTTYVVEAVGAGGETSASAKIGVVLPPPPEVSLTISPQTITQGQSATVSWSASGDVSVVTFIDTAPRTVQISGSTQVSPSTSITYTVEATGQGGKKFATARLQVNPPPPPPPAPPVRRDPGVGREAITDKENTLNNMLGYLSAESVAPKDCSFNKDSMSVICRPQYPVAYPQFQIILRAKDVAMQINSGMPEITKVDIPEAFEGVPVQALIDFKNAGTIADSFDLSLQSKPALSGGTQQFSLKPMQATNASISFSGAVGTYNAKIILQSRNNPFAKAVKDVNITIKKNPLPGEIQRLEKRTDYLGDLVGQGFSKIIMLFIGGMMAVVLILGGILIYLNRTKRRK